MKNGWTGGAYSVARAVLGLTVATHLAVLLWGGFFHGQVPPDSPWRHFLSAFRLHDAPWMGTAVVAAAILTALALAVGFSDRVAAIVLVWLGLSLHVHSLSLIALWPCAGGLLVVHAFTTTRPYGSYDARGRTDPGGRWSLDPRLYLAIWVLLAAALIHIGVHELRMVSDDRLGAMQQAWERGHLDGTRLAAMFDALTPAGYQKLRWAVAGFHLVLAPLALLPRTRRWAWGLVLAMCLVRLLVFLPLDGNPVRLLAHFTVGTNALLLLLCLFAFDPAWIRPRGGDEHETVFYDGDCGLCHGTVRFLLAEDTRGVLRYSPLQSPAFEAAAPPEERAGLPDSVVVQTVEGRLLVRSTGVAHLLQRLGGLWRVLGTVLGWIPRPLRDLGYDAVARVRKRIFPTPQGACPMVAPHLTDRFLI